jgi:acetyl esterase/lipase
LGAAGTSLAGCATGPSILPGVVPPQDGIRLVDDQAYGPHERQRLGVYHPRGTPPAPGWPVLVAFHGGMWQFGDRDEWQMHLLARRLAARGLVVVLANYRLYPEVSFPGFVEDGALAVAWASRNAARFGGNGQMVFAAGHSAGAHIAVMLAMDERFLRQHACRLAGAIGVAGPYGTWFQSNPLVSGAFPAETRQASSPIAIAHGDAPPLLLLGAGLDLIVPPSDTTELARVVRDAGGEAESVIYPLASHTSIMLSILPGTEPAINDIARFITRHANAPGDVARVGRGRERSGA